MSHLVHIGIVDLNLLPSHFEVVLFHGLIDVLCILKLHVGEITPDVPLTAPNLNDLAAVFEKLLELLFLRLFLCPPDPHSAATLWLWSPMRASVAPVAPTTARQ